MTQACTSLPSAQSIPLEQMSEEQLAQLYVQTSPLVQGQIYTVAQLQEARSIHDPKANDVRGLSVHDLAVILEGNKRYDVNQRYKRGY
jgi:hypothetical protein